jgi:hypothetical protein
MALSKSNSSYDELKPDFRYRKKETYQNYKLKRNEHKIGKNPNQSQTFAELVREA